MGTKGRIELDEPFWSPHRINVYDTKDNLLQSHDFPCNDTKVVEYIFKNSSNLHYQVKVGRVAISLHNSLSTLNFSNRQNMSESVC